jgi:transposase
VAALEALREDRLGFRELTMMEVRDVLRRLAAGQSLREIARTTGLDRKTVRRYAEAAAGSGWRADQSELGEALVAEVARRVQDRAAPTPSDERAELHRQREHISQWLESGLRLTKIHVLLKRSGMSASYATLRRFAQDEFGWGKRVASVRLDDPAPGEEAQIDFGCMGTMLDRETGRTRKLWVLVVHLSCSRYSFVYPTFTQDVLAVCAGLDAAWAFFDGVPQRIVPDNMKTIVQSAHATSPRLNDAFRDYAEARGLFVDPARVRHPQDKARVENHVAFVRESWFEGEQFADVEDARRSATHWCREIAGGRIHGTTRRVPREHYEQEERIRMQPAPSEPFDVPLWVDAKVHEDHHIQVARALYSLPTRFIGRRVRVRADRTIVRVYLSSELIKTHPRMPPGGRSTDPNDYPPGKSEYAVRSVEHFVERARKHGPSVGLYTERLLDRSLPWTRMRQAHQLDRMCKKYGRERVDTLCRRALDFDVIDVPRLERMLKTAAQFEDQAEQDGKLKPLPIGRFARGVDAFKTRDKEGA